MGPARRIACCLCAAALLGAGSTANAAKVIVYRTAGPDRAGVYQILVDALTKGLDGHALLLRERPRAWRRTGLKTAPRLGEAVRAAGAEVGIDSMVVKRRRSLLWLLAVKSSGEVVFDKSVRIGDAARVKEMAKDLTLALAEQLRPRGPLPEEAQ